MKLKDFFTSLAYHDQKVEIYFKETTREGDFGFKINDVYCEDFPLYFDLVDEINTGFVEHSSIINEGEGDTSYFIKPDFECVKKGKYFSALFETWQYWIDSNDTRFFFEEIDIPFHNIGITKTINSFKIDEEKELKKILTKQQYEEFHSFYKELLSEFQELEIELELDGEIEEIVCYIVSMNGRYEEEVMFTLLDHSKKNFPNQELKKMLTKYFNIDEFTASKITGIA